MNYFDFSLVVAYKQVFINGLVITLLLAAVSLVIGTALGLVFAFAKRSSNQPLKSFASAYVDFFRMMPILILLVWVYYALPIVSGIHIDAFWTGVLVLSLVLAAYVCETIRAGIEAIPRGHIEAAQTLGLSRLQVMHRIILPQVFRQMLPPLVGNYIELMKNTSLTAIIAVNELLHSGQILISQTYRPLEVYTAIALIYVVIMLPIILLSKKFELSAFYAKTKS